MAKRRNTRKNTRRKNQNKKAIYADILAIIMIGIGILLFIPMFVSNSFGAFGNVIRTSLGFLVGGFMAQVIPCVIVVFGILMLNKKTSVWVYSKVPHIIVAIVIGAALSSVADYKLKTGLDFFDVMKRFFNRVEAGGIFGNLLGWPLVAIGDKIFAYIVLWVVMIIDFIMLTGKSFVSGIKNIFKFLGVVFKYLYIKCKEFFGNLHNEIEMTRDELEKEKQQEKKTEKKTPLSEKIIKTESDEKVQEENEVAETDNSTGGFFRRRNRTIPNITTENAGNEEVVQEEVRQPINISGIGFDDVPPIDAYENETVDQTEIPEMEPNTINELEQMELTDDKDVAELQDILNQAAQQEIEFPYELPPIDLLSFPQTDVVDAESEKSIIMEGALKLESTLASFGVEAKVINVTRGPAVTRYELQPKPGVKVSKIVNLADDIALNLASQGIRIEAPIPGKAAVGIEVPNKEMAAVLLSEIISSQEFQKFDSPVAFALGKGLAGESVVTDISKMPHVLIAGATGSGKSVCINSLLMSIMYKAKPDEVKLLMVDPKVVELGVYNGIPHLLIPVVTDPRKAAGALNWAVKEMTDRYQMFAEAGCRDVKGYNKFASDNGLKKLPAIVIIIDELADLMMVAPNDVEDSICRLAQMARAAGMHLVIATQRPSVDVITGIIKANVPSRIAFSVSSQIDSRTILDAGGAEKLLGKGDMLFHPMGASKATRIKGCFVSDKEVEVVVEYVKSQGTAKYNDKIIEGINNAVTGEKSDNATKENNGDELLDKAAELVIDNGVASVSLIQRKLSVGYARAARIIDQLEERKIIGGYEGSKPRKVLISKQQWQEQLMLKEQQEQQEE